MAGLNSHIISPNQNLVNNHMKVLIIIKLDNDNYQQCGFPIGWIHALQSSVFVLIKYTKRYFLLRSVQDITAESLIVIHFPMYTLLMVMDVIGNQTLTEYSISPLTNASSVLLFRVPPSPTTICLHLRELF